MSGPIWVEYELPFGDVATKTVTALVGNVEFLDQPIGGQLSPKLRRYQVNLTPYPDGDNIPVFAANGTPGGSGQVKAQGLYDKITEAIFHEKTLFSVRKFMSEWEAK